MAKSKILEPLDTTANDALDDVAAHKQSSLIETKRADLPRLRENTRGRIALLLIALLALVVIGVLVLTYLRTLGYGGAATDIKELVTLLLSPLVALVGSVTGFYFGGHED